MIQSFNKNSIAKAIEFSDDGLHINEFDTWEDFEKSGAKDKRVYIKSQKCVYVKTGYIADEQKAN